MDLWKAGKTFDVGHGTIEDNAGNTLATVTDDTQLLDLIERHNAIVKQNQEFHDALQEIADTDKIDHAGHRGYFAEIAQEALSNSPT